MTDERMALIELIEKQADSDLVREMLAYAADRTVINVTNVLLNGGTADLVCSLSGLIRPGTITVS